MRNSVQSLLLLSILAPISSLASSPFPQQFLHPIPDSIVKQTQSAVQLQPTPQSELLHLAIALVPRDLAGLEKFDDAVSNPKSSEYRHFISPSQVGIRFGATPYSVQQVVNYLQSNHFKITLVAQNRMSILADATVQQAENAFHTTLFQYRGLNPQHHLFEFRANPTAIELPGQLASIVQAVGGLNNFDRPIPLTTLTPSLARVLYNTQPSYSNGTQGQGCKVGISNWQPYLVSDVETFEKDFGLPNPAAGAGTNIHHVSVDGSNNTTGPSAEGDLDPEMVLSSAPLADVYIYDDSITNPDPLSVYTREANDNIVDIFTESYGWSLSPNSYISSCHDQHLAMTAQGQTYCCASGDQGTSEIAQYPYPDVDPDVLTVGGSFTAVDSNGNRTGEVAWSGSGGGWLPQAYGSPNINTLPSWQTGTTVPTNIPYRLVPDICLQAWSPHNAFYFVSGNSIGTVSGTSCSSPFFAGGLATLEQRLVANGQPRRFGRINDLIYSENGRADVWYDVTSGSNGTLPNNQVSNAQKGWDFATGWGDPNFGGWYTALAYQYILPSSYKILVGFYDSGNLSSLDSVDSNYLVINPGITINTSEAPIQVEIDGVSPIANPSVMKFDVVSHCNDQIQQTVQLYNWVTNKYDSFNQSQIGRSESTVEVSVSNISNYIQSGTLAIKARMSYNQTGPVLSWPFVVSMNQTLWKIVP